MFATAHRATNELVIVLVNKTPEERGPQGRVAFIAGRKLGNAPARNRAKRVLRATAARLGAPWDGYDAVLVARPRTGSASSADLEAALARALAKAGMQL